MVLLIIVLNNKSIESGPIGFTASAFLLVAEFCICFLQIVKEMRLSLILNINKNKTGYGLGRSAGLGRNNSGYLNEHGFCLSDVRQLKK